MGLGQISQLNPIVDAFDFERIRSGEGPDPTQAAGRLQGIGQIELSLGIAVVQAADRLSQQVSLKHVNGGVDLLDGQFSAGGIPLFDDAQDPSILVANDAAVSGGIIQIDRQYRGSVTGADMVVEQAMQRVRVQQGHVRGDDQHLAVVLELAIQLVHGALNRTPRAWSAVLAHDAHLGIVGPCSLRHQVGLMMNHHCRQLGIQSGH